RSRERSTVALSPPASAVAGRSAPVGLEGVPLAMCLPLLTALIPPPPRCRSSGHLQSSDVLELRRGEELLCSCDSMVQHLVARINSGACDGGKLAACCLALRP